MERLCNNLSRHLPRNGLIRHVFHCKRLGLEDCCCIEHMIGPIFGLTDRCQHMQGSFLGYGIVVLEPRPFHQEPLPERLFREQTVYARTIPADSLTRDSSSPSKVSTAPVT